MPKRFYNLQEIEQSLETKPGIFVVPLRVREKGRQFKWITFIYKGRPMILRFVPATEAPSSSYRVTLHTFYNNFIGIQLYGPSYINFEGRDPDPTFSITELQEQLRTYWRQTRRR